MMHRRIGRSRVLRQGLLGLGALYFAACTSSPSAKTSFKIATEPSFAPFESKGADGKLVGFDIELMTAIATTAGWTPEFQPMPFDGIIPALQAGTVDAAISAMTITPERSQTVSFSRPYFKAGLAIAVKQENTSITSLEGLKNQAIAVQIGTTGAKVAKSITGAKVREFDTAPLALQELVNGNVVAVINDAPVTMDAIKQGKIKGVKIVNKLVTEEFYGIAVPKNSPHLAAINSALDQLISNGTYAEIYKKWFDGKPPVLPK